MFTKKRDLDAHVQEIFKKTKSEKERNFKCMTFARQYAQLKEWAVAKRYATAYLLERPNSAQALRLQGECDENLQHKEKALNAYRSSLAIDGTQRELVFKVCELLCCVPADADAYQYWSERAEQLDNGHPVVFKLREHMLNMASEKSDNNTVRKELEDLILAEQKARPYDPRPKCRLLKLYLEKGQVVEAYQLAVQTENQTPFTTDIYWYETLCNVFDEYKKRGKVDWEFHAQKLLILDRMTALCLTETKLDAINVTDKDINNSKTPSKLNASTTPTSACVEAIYLLDQALFEAYKTALPAQIARRQAAQALLSHVAAQLTFYMATLLLKKAKKDGSQWATALKCSGPLLLLACQTSPPDEDAAWLRDLTEAARGAAKVWIAAGQLRRSQAGNILLVLNQKKKFLDSVAPFMVTKWQDRLYETFFPSRIHQQNRHTSYFASLCDTSNLAITLPTPDDLWSCDESAQIQKRDDLNYLIWYGLLFLPYGHPWNPISQSNDDPSLAATNVVPKCALCPQFENLKLFTREIAGFVPATPETLCQLDVDAFLYATVVCAATVQEEQKKRWSDERPSTLPTIISDALCTSLQAQWWSSVCWLIMPSSSNKCVSLEVRRTLKSGLEAVRAVEGQSGLQDVRLLSALARYFSGRAFLAEEAKESSDIVAALYARASHYWSCAKPALERIKADRGTRQLPSDRMFFLPGKELDKDSAQSLLYEASYTEAVQLERAGRLEEAIEAFSELPSPYASMRQALLYKELGGNEQSDETLKKALLTRARDSLYVTLDRLRAPKVDPRHPLNAELRDHIEEVEDHINTLFPDNTKASGRYGLLSDTSSEEEQFTSHVTRTPQNMSSLGTPVSARRTPRDARHHNGTPVNGNRQLHQSFRSTPRDVTDGGRLREEARPSPERLDAQLRQLMLQRDSELQAMARLVEAARSDDHGTKDELKTLNKKVVETQTEVQELRRENQELQKCVKDIQVDVQKLVKALMATQLQAASPGVSEPHNIPDEELYLYGDEELENEYSADIAAAAAAHLGTPYPQQTATHPQARVVPPANPVAAVAAAAAAASYPALPPGFQFRAPGFFPLARAVDPALMYQQLSYYSQGALPFSEGQRLPDFQIPPQMLPGAGVLPTIPPPVQPASVFARLGPILSGVTDPTLEPGISAIQTQENVVTPQRPVQAPPTMTPQTSAAGMMQGMPLVIPGYPPEAQQPHNFQISMPPQAQIPTESPLDKTPSMGGLVVSPKSILQSVPSPEFSSVVPVTPEGQKQKKDTPRRTQRISTGSGVGSEDGDDIPEHDPCPDFQPIIPLPDEIVPTTGEEGEKVLFECRAKLYRYVENEWKERGVGMLKILENPSTGKARILMRREQVLKVCCNHIIPANLVLTHIANNDRTWSWAAQDFAEEQMKPEKLGVRFKTVDEANLFKEVVESATVAAAKAGTSPVKEASPVVQPVDTKTPSSGLIFTAPKLQPANQATFTPPITPAAFTTPTAQTTEKSGSSSGKVSLGGFTFTSPPTIVQKAVTQEEPKQKVEAPKPSPFANFSFGSPAPPTFGKPAPIFGTPTTGDNNGNKTTPSLNTTKVFESSPMSQLSFANIAKQANPAATPTQKFQGFDGAGSKVFGSPATPSASKLSVTSPGTPEDGTVEEFEPNVDFKPVVPLPELVDVKTGEEGEEVLYEQRAKLLRFDMSSKEWKERGVGKMKITLNPRTGRVRLIMRREQVLKVCCNHFLVSDMVLQPLKASDRSWMWYAQDYSEGTLEKELFAIKFKNPDEALAFRDKWNELQKEMTNDKLLRGGESQTKSEVTPAEPKALSELFKPAAGSWECKYCYTRNAADKVDCAACSNPRPEAVVSKPASTTVKPLSEMFKPAAGSWECTECYTRNKGDTTKCVACMALKPGCEEEASTTAKSTGTPLFSFGMPTVTPGAPPTSQPATTFTFGTPTATASVSSGDQKATTTTSFVFGTNAAPKTSFVFGTGQPQQQLPQAPVTTAAASSFSFGTPKTSFVFGGNKPQENSPNQVTFNFSSNVGTNKEPNMPNLSSTATPPNQSTDDKTDSAFKFGGPHKFEFNFKPSASAQGSPPKTTRSPRTSTSVASPGGAEEESDGEVENDEGDHIHFTPVIPLPEMVQVVTGEEEEDILYCQRAKLYRLVDAEWKERGIGDFKILKHKINKTVRFLMRRDQVLKICLNHRLTADLLIEPKDKDDKSFVWVAQDFSEQEMRQERFAIRFKTPEIATNFKAAVTQVQESLASGEESFPSTPSVDGSMLVQAGTPYTVSRMSTADADTTVSSTTSNQLESPAMLSFSFAQATPSDGPPAFSLGGLFGASELKEPIRRNIFGGGAVTSKQSDDEGVELVSVQNASPEEVEQARKLQLPDNFYLYKQKPNCPGCRGCEEYEDMKSTIPTNQSAAPVFAGPAKFPLLGAAPVMNGQSEDKSSVAAAGVAFLPTANKLDFATLAKQPSPFTLPATPSKGFIWEGVGAPVFGSPKTSSSPSTKTDKRDDSSGEEEGGEEDTHDPHFEPIVALPDAIEVRTGEEDEEKLFSQRAKLFRYDPDLKEWKERGVGDMKILHHVASGAYRLLLRREQVHKVVLNQLITPAMEITSMSMSPNARCWAGMNHAEEEPKLEKLAVRFKNEELLNEFCTKIEECKASLKVKQSEAPSGSITGPVLSPLTTAEPSNDNMPTTLLSPVTLAPQVHEVEEDEDEEAGEEDYETYDDEEDEDEEDEDEGMSVMFEKRVTLLERGLSDPEGQWKALGQGTLRVIHEFDMGGMRVLVEKDDTGEIVCNMPIEVDSVIVQETKDCLFTGHDMVQEEPEIKHFKARFSSTPAAEEFKINFLEGMSMAEQNAAYDEEEAEA